MESKPAIKSKTVLYSIILMILGIIQQVVGVLPDLITGEYLGVALTVLGAVSLVLRFLTGQPLGSGASNGLKVLLPLVLIMGVAGCGIDLKKAIAKGSFIITKTGEAGEALSPVIGISCEFVAEFGGSDSDVETCREWAEKTKKYGKTAQAGGKIVKVVGDKVVDVFVPEAEALKACPVPPSPTGDRP